MPIFIYEKGAFKKLVAVEGLNYPRNQRNFGVCSFSAFKNKWKKLNEANKNFKKFKPAFCIDVEGNRAIYGLGGWNRYVVLNTGEIMLLQASVEIKKDIEKARQVGFRIFPQDLIKEEDF